MQFWLQLSILIVLSVLVIQDFKYRSVYWIIFPVLLILFVCFALLHVSFKELLLFTGFNLSYILLIFIMVTVFFSIKERKIVAITKKLIGWGDILFFLVIALLFSPANFIAFFILSLVVVLLLVALLPSIASSIPLAGIQAFFLIVILITGMILKFSFYNDSWLLKIMI